MNRTKYHTEYGRHSLIPDCCIRFFVEEWDPFFENKWRGTAYEGAIREQAYDYVPCPQCFYTNKRVKIRICMDECGHECDGEFKRANA